jgi:hypothetical protein
MNEMLRRARRVAFLVGGAATVLVVLGGVFAAQAFARAWLVAVLLCLGIAVGCLAIAFMHQLAGGQWGVAIERLLEAGGRTIPWLALAFVPLLFFLHGLYEWTRADVVQHEARLAHKAAYLNVPFFVVRAAVYFATWTLLAVLLDRWSRARDERPDPGLTVRLRGLGAAGLIALGVTVSFAAIDWVMSLEPTWYSTVFGGMVGLSFMLGAFAFVIALVMSVGDGTVLAPVLTDKVRIDLGNLLLTFVILWTYLAFVQLLICWSGNIPEEVSWYVHRLNGGWQAVAAFLAIGRFFIPLFVLLSRAWKRSRRVMITLACFVLVTQWVDMVWLVLPSFHPGGFGAHWLDVVAPIALGGLWLGLFFTLLAQRPLLPVHDPASVSIVVRHAT